MREKPRHDERRREPRYPLRGMILWAPTDGKRTFTGWLSDVSPRSVSFIASSSRKPALGDEVELHRTGCLRKRCRVTRTSTYSHGESLVLVACSNVD